MILRDISFDDPAENILFDEVLLDLAEKNGGPEVLRFWESPVLFIVLGRICKLEHDVKKEQTTRDHIVVLRRCSGGGTVLQGPGCLNYSLILSKDKNPSLRDLRHSYEVILGQIVKALASRGIESIFLPICDIALKNNQMKFSGNAQKRGKNFILHHGTILYNFDLKAIGQYLQMPTSIPEYRRGRSHDQFVTNLNLSKKEIKDALKTTFFIETENHGHSAIEKEMLAKVLETRNPYVSSNERR